MPLHTLLLINIFISPTPSKDKPSKKLAEDRRQVFLKMRREHEGHVERKEISRPTGLKRLRKVGMSQRVKSSEDQEIDETQVRQNDDLIFDTGVLDDVEMPVEAKLGERITTAGDDSVVLTTNKEITLAQTLIQIKVAKPKVVTTAATTTTTTRSKAQGRRKEECLEIEKSRRRIAERIPKKPKVEEEQRVKVPPPHPIIYNRPNKLDLSYSGLEEFQQPEYFEGVKDLDEVESPVCGKEEKINFLQAVKDYEFLNLNNKKSSLVSVKYAECTSHNVLGKSKELEYIRSPTARKLLLLLNIKACLVQ
ncbi:hypothetical protein Tco_1195802 [Tanacetum coccineum]|uniref:Uncharacterized protein n=1 Tax=Tanacetum coccineum TaxID=301880 RepID=A0ABQ5HUZ7_9ASTR